MEKCNCWGKSRRRDECEWESASGECRRRVVDETQQQATCKWQMCRCRCRCRNEW